jgi:regulator of Ty1 transposition protein 109
MTSPITTMSNHLRDYLLTALAIHPGTRSFHVHVLISAPQRTNGLYPFATPRVPKVCFQDVLVILSEETAKPRVIVAGIQATVYNSPQTSSAILYVSKVDSTGQASAPSPTALLVRSFVKYYVDPKTRPLDATYLWVQLFARAQDQYLFLGSKDCQGKKPLGDAKLCGWWRSCLARVVQDIEGDEDARVRMFYVLPGYSEKEAEDMLRIGGGKVEMKWEYGHPYSQKEVPMPCPIPSGGEDTEDGRNLGRFIPYFDDDPKSRFLDEIGYSTELRSPQKKKKTEKEEPNRPLGEMTRVSTDEFWERMSFRQECVSGAVTGFFTVVVWCPKTRLRSIPPLAPQPGQVSAQINKRIITLLGSGLDFSTEEKAAKGTELLESTIRGLCEGLVPVTTTTTTTRDDDERPKTPERKLHGHVPDVSPNPFAEPVASLETYHQHIYGKVTTANEISTRKSEESGRVTKLEVRRKKRKLD